MLLAETAVGKCIVVLVASYYWHQSLWLEWGDEVVKYQVFYIPKAKKNHTNKLLKVIDFFKLNYSK